MTAKSPIHPSWNEPAGIEAMFAAQDAMWKQLRRQWSKHARHHDDIVQTATLRLMEFPVPDKLEAQAKRLADETAADWKRKRKRQTQALRERAGDVRRATIGQPSTVAEVRRYGKHEEPLLRAAVHEHCLEEYRKAWRKDWNPVPAQRLRDFGHDEHAEAEKEARAVLKSLESAAPIGDEKPWGRIGGPAVQLLWEVRHFVAKRSASMTRIGWLDESELRRFVARARLNPAVSIYLGCARPPPNDPAAPRPRWIMRPSIDELTLVCLLAGFWPEIRRWPKAGITVRNLVNRRMRPTIAAADREVGWEGRYGVK